MKVTKFVGKEFASSKRFKVRGYKEIALFYDVLVDYFLDGYTNAISPKKGDKFRVLKRGNERIIIEQETKDL
jgi:hypothetical protein